MVAALIFFFLLILIAMIIYFTLDPDPISTLMAFSLVNMPVVIFIVWMFLRSDENRLLQERISEARTSISVAVTPSNVTYDNDNNGNHGGSDSKNCVPIPCYAKTATATTGARRIRFFSLFIRRPSSDRDYAALPADKSVHDAHDVVIGVPVSAQQKL
jgi:hypothetical protein